MLCPQERQLTQCEVSRYTLQFIHRPHHTNVRHQMSQPQVNVRKKQLVHIVNSIGLHITLNMP